MICSFLQFLPTASPLQRLNSDSLFMFRLNLLPIRTRAYLSEEEAPTVKDLEPNTTLNNHCALSVEGHLRVLEPLNSMIFCMKNTGFE